MIRPHAWLLPSGRLLAGLVWSLVPRPRTLVETALGLAGATLMTVCILLPGWSLLCFVAFTPLAVIYGRTGGRSSLLPAIAAMVTWTVAFFYPFIRYGGPSAAVILSAEGILFLVPAWMLLRASGDVLPGVPVALRLPVFWCASEWLFIRFEFFRVPALALSNPLAEWPLLVQAADIVGGLGLSFFVMMVVGAGADLLLAAVGGWLYPDSPASAWPKARLACVACAAALAALLGYGFVRMDRSEPLPGPRVALVQPCLPHVVGLPHAVALEQELMTLRHVRPGSVDMVVWPENAIMDFGDKPDRYMDDLAWLSRSLDCWMLVGVLGRSPEDPFRSTNRALLLSPGGRPEGHYDKVEIIPWAEYFPFEAFFDRFAPAVNLFHRRLVLTALGAFPIGTAGTSATLLPFRWQGRSLPFSAILCSEGAIPYRVRSSAALGARCILNPMSEGEVGGVVQLNMMRLCRLRAVENRVPFVRAGNTGITCVIDESGIVRDLLRGEKTGALVSEPGVLLTRIPLREAPRSSLYRRIGDVFQTVCFLVSTACAVWFGWRSRRPRRAAAAGSALAIVLLCGSCRGDTPRARVDYATALSKGIAAFEQKRDFVALRDFQRALSVAPDRAEPYRYIAEIYRRRNQPFDGLAFFAENTARAAAVPEVLSYVAYFQMDIHDKTSAMENFVRSLDARPDQKNSVVYLTMLALDANRPDVALPRIERFLRLHPDDEDVRVHYAESLLAAGRSEEAARQASAILAVSPRQPVALRVQGLLALAADDLEAARRHMEASAASDPKSIETRYHEGRVALRRGDLAGARRIIDAIHELEKGDFHR